MVCGRILPLGPEGQADGVQGAMGFAEADGFDGFRDDMVLEKEDVGFSWVRKDDADVAECGSQVGRDGRLQATKQGLSAGKVWFLLA